MNHTQDFIMYLTEVASGGKQFRHQYRHNELRKDFSFNSLEDAFLKYCWPPRPGAAYDGFEASSAVLEDLSKKIKEAFRAKSNEDLFDASREILEWGGVLNGNEDWLIENKESLFQLYQTVEKSFKDKTFKVVPRSNAGFTKIYALLFDDFAIYDSRVAATFGLLAVGYCREKMLNLLPDELNFVRMNGRGHLRDASTGGISFRAMNYQSPAPHAQSNDKANYILTQVVRRVSRNSPFHGDVRKLEAALFMIGYDLKGHEWLAK